MTSWKKLCFMLMMALSVMLGGASLAATPTPSAALPAITLVNAADTPSQSQDTPVDCKRKPDDPRCKNKPY